MTNGGANADGPIDYAHCDPSKKPAIIHQPGEATTYSSVFANVLVPVCSSCHHPGTSSPTTFYIEDAVKNYSTLLYEKPSESMFPYVTKGDPTKSLLYLKLTSKAGTQMPLGGTLDQNLIDGVAVWLSQGANNN